MTETTATDAATDVIDLPDDLPELPEDLPANVAAVLEENITYIAETLRGPNALSLRFLRFRPERELRHTLAVASRLAVLVERSIPDAEREADWEPPTVEQILADDPVCDVLRDAIRVHDRNSASATCPAGYAMPPYPVTTAERDTLLRQAAEALLPAAARALPGAVDGWTWEPTVSVVRGELVVRFKPVNRSRPSA